MADRLGAVGSVLTAAVRFAKKSETRNPNPETNFKEKIPTTETQAAGISL
jgi:hypothetical protein